MQKLDSALLFALALAACTPSGSGGGGGSKGTGGAGGGTGDSSSSATSSGAGGMGSTSTSSATSSSGSSSAASSGTGGDSSSSSSSATGGTGGDSSSSSSSSATGGTGGDSSSSSSSSATGGTGGDSSSSSSSASSGTGGAPGCGSANPPCPPPDLCHDPGICDLATGECSNPPKAEGAPCDDGDACSQVDTCQAGLCGGSPLSSFSPGATVWTTKMAGPEIDTHKANYPAQWWTTDVKVSTSGRAFFGVMSSVPLNAPFSDYINTAYGVDGAGKTGLLAHYYYPGSASYSSWVSADIDIQVFGANHYVVTNHFTNSGNLTFITSVKSDNGAFQSSYQSGMGSSVVAGGNAAGDLLVAGVNTAEIHRIDANKTTLYTRALGARASTIQAGAGGDAYLSGSLSGGVDVGCGPIAGSGGFAARLDPMGQCVWSRSAPLQTSFLLGSVVDYLTGPLQGTLDLGCGPLTSTSSASTYLAALDAAGACVWSRSLDGLSPTLLPSGDLLLTGPFTGALDLGCGQVTSGPGASYLVARIDAAGICLWDRALAVPSALVGVSASGDLTVSAAFAGTVDLGTGPLTSAGVKDLAVARLDGNTGSSVWTAQVGGAGATLSAGLVKVDDGGGVLATGTVDGTADLGGGPLTGGFLLRLDGAGAFRWQRALAGKATMDACGATTTLTLTDTCFNCGFYKHPTFTVERIAP